MLLAAPLVPPHRGGTALGESARSPQMSKTTGHRGRSHLQHAAQSTPRHPQNCLTTYPAGLVWFRARYYNRFYVFRLEAQLEVFRHFAYARSARIYEERRLSCYESLPGATSKPQPTAKNFVPKRNHKIKFESCEKARQARCYNQFSKHAPKQGNAKFYYG